MTGERIMPRNISYLPKEEFIAQVLADFRALKESGARISTTMTYDRDHAERLWENNEIAKVRFDSVFYQKKKESVS